MAFPTYRLPPEVEAGMRGGPTYYNVIQEGDLRTGAARSRVGEVQARQSRLVEDAARLAHRRSS
jgi:hypothetical protein